jgi:hypothetical protein
MLHWNFELKTHKFPTQSPSSTSRFNWLIPAIVQHPSNTVLIILISKGGLISDGGTKLPHAMKLVPFENKGGIVHSGIIHNIHTIHTRMSFFP